MVQYILFVLKVPLNPKQTNTAVHHHWYTRAMLWTPSQLGHILLKRIHDEQCNWKNLLSMMNFLITIIRSMSGKVVNSYNMYRNVFQNVFRNLTSLTSNGLNMRKGHSL